MFYPVVLILLLIGRWAADGAIVTTEDVDGYLGQSASVVCGFSAQSGETIDNLSLLRQRVNESWNEIARFIPSTESAYFLDVTLPARAKLTLTPDTATLQFLRVECVDEAAYRCMLNLGWGSVLDQMELRVVGQPQKPKISVTEPPAIEGQFVEATCSVDVGRPPGNIAWFGYRSNGQVIDMTSSAGTSGPSPTPNSCTYRRTSTLGIQAERLDNEMVFRCVVSHELTNPKPTPDGPCSDGCRETDPLVVHYPVLPGDINISQSPARDNYPIESDVTLTCVSDGNPTPKYAWIKGFDDVKSVEPRFHLRRLHSSDSGRYTCNATNVIDGKRYTATGYTELAVGISPRLNTENVFFAGFLFWTLLYNPY